MLFKKVKNDKIKPMVKAVFFDLDDTIVNSLPLHLKANQLAFEKFGYDYNSIQKKVKDIDFMGRRVSDILIIKREASSISENEMPIKKLVEARENIFLELVKKETAMLPGVINLLEKLKEHNTIIAIVSSGTKKYIDTCIDKFNFNKYINFIVSGDQVSKGKPNPECYIKAFQYLNIKYGHFEKSECLVVEDTKNGLIAGHKAGLKTLLVPSKYSVLPKTIKPDYQIKSLEEFDLKIIVTG
ncbi:MAG: HAD-superfamily hydrolase, subfamily IA, variant 3 [uncultured bacterium]|nr:MAG: HAD-superfamily hydrolase, subfamily IA, variant 3 [uncultured bacterium]